MQPARQICTQFPGQFLFCLSPHSLHLDCHFSSPHGQSQSQGHALPLTMGREQPFLRIPSRLSVAPPHSSELCLLFMAFVGMCYLPHETVNSSRAKSASQSWVYFSQHFALNSCSINTPLAMPNQCQSLNIFLHMTTANKPMSYI